MTADVEAPEDYTGHELDAETGMHYAGARYYMSALGRWTAVDPLADKNYNDSPYTYVVNNPVLFLDPTGRDTTRDSRRMSQDEVITATSTTTTGGLAIIDGAVTSTGSKTAAKAVSRAGGTASILFVGFSIYNDPSRENVVSELSTTGGGAAGGALGGLFCGAGSAATAGAASGSCMITIPGGAAIGTVLGLKFGDAVNSLWDTLESESDDTPPEAETTREDEQHKPDTRGGDSEPPNPETEEER